MGGMFKIFRLVMLFGGSYNPISWWMALRMKKKFNYFLMDIEVPEGEFAAKFNTFMWVTLIGYLLADISLISTGVATSAVNRMSIVTGGAAVTQALLGWWMW